MDPQNNITRGNRKDYGVVSGAKVSRVILKPKNVEQVNKFGPHTKLNEREAKVIELRYGLDGESPRSLNEVAKTFGVTKERIRQIEVKSLMKMWMASMRMKRRGQK